MHLDATARRSALLSLLCARKGEREKESYIAPEIGLLAKISMIFFPEIFQFGRVLLFFWSLIIVLDKK